MRFYDAWHIEGSVQVVVSFVTSKVENIINNKNSFNWNITYKKEYKNIWISWDLWKFSEPNLVWVPQIPPFKFDYFQAEATYAWREHPNKKVEFEKLITEINNAEWKVLIAAFSLQRTQEIIVELLENIEKNMDLVKKYSKLKREFKTYKSSYDKLLKKTELSLEENENKISLFNNLSKIQSELTDIKTKVFLYSIIVDSPLSEKISQIFLSENPEKYKMLDSEYQKSVFWKEIIRKLDQWEYTKLYDQVRKYVKDIIISSWWMLQWGAIINHLKEIISDPKATLIFTWYQAENTIWWKIVLWKNEILEKK